VLPPLTQPATTTLLVHACPLQSMASEAWTRDATRAAPLVTTRQLVGYDRLVAYFDVFGILGAVGQLVPPADPLNANSAADLNPTTDDGDAVVNLFISALGKASSALCATYDSLWGPLHVYVLMARSFYILVSMVVPPPPAGQPDPAGRHPKLDSDAVTEAVTWSNARAGWAGLAALAPAVGPHGEIVWSPCNKPRMPSMQDWRARATGPTSRRATGYTTIHLGRRVAADGTSVPVAIDAHRLMCWLEWGPPPSGAFPPGTKIVAMHLCHNTKCLNPYHLRWGCNIMNLGAARPAWRCAALPL
jgi:hypothetical protein